MSIANRVQLMGNLGSDPEVRYTRDGIAVCNFRMATNERYKDKQQKLQERTEWHRIVAWGKAAENCGEYLKKGALVFVEGALRTRQWEDRDKVKRFTTEVHTGAGGVTFLDRKNANVQSDGKSSNTEKASSNSTGSNKSKVDDDIAQELDALTNDEPPQGVSIEDLANPPF